MFRLSDGVYSILDYRYNLDIYLYYLYKSYRGSLELDIDLAAANIVRLDKDNNVDRILIKYLFCSRLLVL